MDLKTDITVYQWITILCGGSLIPLAMKIYDWWKKKKDADEDDEHEKKLQERKLWRKDLQDRVKTLEAICKDQKEDIEKLTEENTNLKVDNAKLKSDNKHLKERLKEK